MGDLENARRVAITYLRGDPRPPRLRSLIDVDGDLYAYNDRRERQFPYVLQGARSDEYDTLLVAEGPKYSAPWWWTDVDRKNIRSIHEALLTQGWHKFRPDFSYEDRTISTGILRRATQRYVVWVKFHDERTR